MRKNAQGCCAMKIIVTCGPGYEPIDQVRRLTNFSTGSLGFLLSTQLSRAGHEVICLKGALSTSLEPLEAARQIEFSTNESLLDHLRALSAEGGVGAVLHVAALCDYRIAAARDANGTVLDVAKIPSRAGSLTLQLEPAEKVIRHLRPLFPCAFLLGWKYELNGNRENVAAAARAQISENQTDGCVLNGAAYGTGFGVMRSHGLITELPGSEALAGHICKLLAEL
jgi:phosphopantothenoylcysteine decarboxylase/phosphopantothenate--cysteine ligase